MWSRCWRKSGRRNRRRKQLPDSAGGNPNGKNLPSSPATLVSGGCDCCVRGRDWREGLGYGLRTLPFGHHMITDMERMNNAIMGAWRSKANAVHVQQSFPAISTQGMSKHQLALLKVLKAEYAAQPAGTAFSQGVSEAWCADFVSWVYRQAGLPFNNLNSGSWRIPGVATLEQYFRDAGMFHAAGSGYTPQFGDIVIYDANASKIPTSCCLCRMDS